MAEINDGMLLKALVEFCDTLNSEEELSEYKLEDGTIKTFHPLDKDVKEQLENIKQKATNASKVELTYELSDEIDLLWNTLIEKAIVCLRYFDKREPFMKNGKNQYVCGLDNLEAYHKKYVDFEGVLYGSDSYYRDHVFHVIRVWMLGVYLMLSKNTLITGCGKRLIDLLHFEGEGTKHIREFEKGEFENQHEAIERNTYKIITDDEGIYKVYRSNMDDMYFSTSPNSFSNEINFLEKLSMWTLMSLCHDLGYPLEKSKKVLEKTEDMMEAFIANPNINGNFRFDGTQDSNNLDIIEFASKKMKYMVDEKKNVVYKASIQDKYSRKYKLSLEKFSHGIISTIIIFKMLMYFIEADNNRDSNYVFSNEDARQFYIRRDILRAIASHTCKDIYHMDVTTFPMLLFVCDELQEWGRKSWKSLYRGVAHGGVKLSITAFNANKIEYLEKIDMSNVMGKQLLDNIDRIIKKQYILYLTTFRDGQDTAKRQFDYLKHIRINVSDKYKSIETIDIDFSINHGSKDNQFELTIKNSGDTDAKDTDVKSLTEGIEELLKPYIENKKYGKCSFVDERKK